MTQYRCTTIIRDFTDSISQLEFSPDGAFLATGTEDGTLIITEVSSMKCHRHFKRHSAITALLWCGSESPSLIIGYQDGTLEILKGLSKIKTIQISVDFEGPVAHLSYSESPTHEKFLAVSTCVDVFVLSQLRRDVWQTAFVVPRPTWKIERHIEPRAVHWARPGRTIIICYLRHGFVSYNLSDRHSANWVLPVETHIAYSDYSEKLNQVAFSNLYDGFTVYKFTPYDFEYWNIERKNDNNVALPVRFIHHSEDLLLGSPTGRVCITSAREEEDRRFYYLSHDALVIQSLAYHQTATKSIIATGSSSGADSTVWIWRSISSADPDDDAGPSNSGLSFQDEHESKSSKSEASPSQYIPNPSVSIALSPKPSFSSNEKIRPETTTTPVMKRHSSIMVGVVTVMLLSIQSKSQYLFTPNLAPAFLSFSDRVLRITGTTMNTILAEFGNICQHFQNSKLAAAMRLYMRAFRLFFNQLTNWWHMFWVLVEDMDDYQ
ncbi:hypothetical protein QCA50_014074 [Cerrena zonata]|uniref:Anaphase-promoting complex subunit 4-like WD40 domain-containing protein n=1 Tax=Cerrena zonata TaxID=2478898 RepID=A0AAW0FPC6_9APHY